MGQIRSHRNNGGDLIKSTFCLEMHFSKCNQMGGNSQQTLGRVDLMPLIFSVQDWAASQRCGVISLVNSPPLNQNFAKATSRRQQSKLNTIGQNWSQKYNGVNLGQIRSHKNNGGDLITSTFCLEMHLSKCNQMGGNSSQTIGGVDLMPLIFSVQDWAASQRYGVISLVNSPPLNQNFAKATSRRQQSKLNTIGQNWSQK